MVRKYKCTSCGTKHSPPVGKDCDITFLEEEVDRVDQSESISGGISVMATVQSLTNVVAELAKEVSEIKEITVRNTCTQDSDTSRDNVDMHGDANIDELRRSTILGARVDAAMTSDPALRVLDDMMNIHALTGGKLYKSPRDTPVRKIIHHILWPNQFVSRLAGASAGLNMTTYPWQNL